MKNKQYKFRTIVSEVSSFVGNPASNDERCPYLCMQSVGSCLGSFLPSVGKAVVFKTDYSKHGIFLQYAKFWALTEI